MLAAAAIGMAALLAGTAAGNSSAFHGWQVVDVPEWDALNIRAWPSAKSQILAAYPNGTMLSLTGQCTNGLHLDEIGGMPGWKQRQEVRYRWCEAWIDPEGNGAYRTAWVYGRYIAPN